MAKKYKCSWVYWQVCKMAHAIALRLPYSSRAFMLLLPWSGYYAYDEIHSLNTKEGK